MKTGTVLHRRAEDARDSISAKLQRARRLYLREISACAGKRAAFEILTELPVDWDKPPQRLEPQPDEPWRKPSMRAPDMLLTAESGWMGDFAHGPNRMAEARQALNDYRAEHGLDPIDWSTECSDATRSVAGAARRDAGPVRPTGREAARSTSRRIYSA